MSNEGMAGSLIDFWIAVEKHEVLDSIIFALNEDFNSFWVELGNSEIIRSNRPQGGPSWDGLAVLTDKNGEKILLLHLMK